MVNACVFLLDDLVKFNSYRLVNAVTEEHHKYSKYPMILTDLWSNAVFFIDKWFFNTIKNYNKGLITTEQFVTKMSSQFSLEKSEFVDIWKSIYQISPNVKESFVQKINSLNQSEVFVAGVTNQIHFEYFLEQLDHAGAMKNSNFYKLLSYKSVKHSDSIKDIIEEGLCSGGFINEYNLSTCNSNMVEISGINFSEECCIDPICPNL